MSQNYEGVLEMLNTALEMEQKGQAFYKKAIAECVNEVGREIFTTLMKDEIVHVDRIKTICTELTGTNKWNDKWTNVGQGHTEMQTLFCDLANKYGKDVETNASDIKALDIGIDFESKSVAFYAKFLGQAKDPIEKKFIERMVAEEKSHHAVLVDMKEYLVNPAGWFEAHEHHGLDGA